MNDAITCIHRQSGLCPACQTAHDADPSAWLVYGNHPAGIARWEALQEEMRQDAAAEEAYRRHMEAVQDPTPAAWEELPF